MPRECKRFTKEEDQFLINNYALIATKEIAKKLNRKITAIKDRTAKLSITGRKHSPKFI